jgi:hypothetical protein
MRAPYFKPTPHLDRTMLELREHGLSYESIAIVLDLYEGVDVKGDQVRYRCLTLGAEMNPNKARSSAKVLTSLSA